MEKTKDLMEALNNGIITFKYLKKTGEVREARGTRCPEYINNTWWNTANGCGPARYGYVSYWDVEVDDWRCFEESRVVEVCSDTYEEIH